MTESENIEKFLDTLAAKFAENPLPFAVANIIHRPGSDSDPAIPGEMFHSGEFDSFRIYMAVCDDAFNIHVYGLSIPNEIYLRLPRILFNHRFRNINLSGYGWWLDESIPPEKASVADHVACHIPNPLTGTLRARKGHAFLDMKSTYKENPDGNIPSAVIWHTDSTDGLNVDEALTALEAGCAAASPVIVPWAVGVKAADYTLSADIIFI